MKSAIIAVLLISFNTCYSQNLVPNPSFEEYLDCPSSVSQFDATTDWFQPSLGTVDYFHTCATIPFVGVPVNFVGNQHPVSGDAYAGIAPYTQSILFPATTINYREYIEVQLNEMLTSGTTYYVSFFVSRSDSSNFAISEIGMHFSADSIIDSSGAPVFEVVPQIVSDSNSFLSDTDNWTQISGEYLANGGERFITIGNFKDSITTDTLFLFSGTPTSSSDLCAYYYIDDVYVSTEGLGIHSIDKPPKQLIRIVDILGRDIEYKSNTLMIYIYSDGTTEKVFIVE